jgi:ribosomal protein S18 acetylase RimI-like enzyme
MLIQSGPKVKVSLPFFRLHTPSFPPPDTLAPMASLPISVRPAERRDLEALGRLGAMLMRVHYAFDPQRFLAAGDSAESGYGWFLGTMLEASETNCVFVAEVDGVVVGYVWGALEPLSWKELRGPAGFVHDIAVDEAFRGRRVAELLMDAALTWLRTHGAPRAVLWTSSRNEVAHALFARLGFRDTMTEMTLEL